MTNGRFWAACVAGGLTLFVVGFLLWGLALSGFYEAHMNFAPGFVKEPMDFPHLVLSQFFWAVLLAVVIRKYAGVSGFGAGAKIGALLGFLMNLHVGLSMFSMWNLNDLTVTLTDPFVSLVWSGIGGGVIGVVLAGRPEEAAA